MSFDKIIKNLRKASLLFFSMITILVSCKKEEMTTDSKPIITKNLVLINENVWNNNIKYVDTNNLTFTFSADISLTNKINPGDIILSSKDGGYLRKAKKITVTNKELVIETEQAYITDVIKNGEVKFSKKLSQLDIKEIKYYYDGIQFSDKATKSGDSYNWDINSILYDLDGNPNSFQDQIKIVGSFDVSWSIEGLIKIDILSGLKEANFGYKSEQTLDLELISGIEYSFDKEFTLATITFSPIIVMVGVLPVIFTPVFDIKLGFSGYAMSCITVGFNQKLSFSSGIMWNKTDGWKPYKEFNSNFSIHEPKLEVNAGTDIYIKPSLSLDIYSIAGPYIDIKAYGSLNADIFKKPWWVLKCGMKMNAGVKADILDCINVKCSINDIINIEKTVAEASNSILSVPTVKTLSQEFVSSKGAFIKGKVTNDGKAPVSEYGIVFSNSTNPTILDTKIKAGQGVGEFSVNIRTLNPNTNYYVRTYAINQEGISYGDEINFITNNTITDIEGNIYNTVTIGDQIWFVDNLKTTKFSDGLPIPSIPRELIKDNYDPKSFAYWWYDDDISNKDLIGALYNWFAVNTGNLCPIGWHVPTSQEWAKLINTLGGKDVAGGKLKTPGDTWCTANPNANIGATNESGFTAYMSGHTFGDGFCGRFIEAVWWSTTESNLWFQSECVCVSYDLKSMNDYMSGGKTSGFSVRCIKDDDNLPNIATLDSKSITYEGAILNGNIINSGSSSIKEYGFVFGKEEYPTIKRGTVINGDGSGLFYAQVKNLDNNTKYYYRAYAVNSSGLVYGKQKSFLTDSHPVYPGTTTPPIKIGDIWWAPVNVGYSQENPYGLYFQWHRKYGQDYSNYETFIGPVSLEFGNKYENRNIYIHTSKISDKDWCITEQDFWSTETKYNPCPDGWEVPTSTQMNTLLYCGNSWTDSGGPYYLPGVWCGPNHDNINLRANSSLFLPAAGCIDNSRNIEGYYWTRTDFNWTGSDLEAGNAWNLFFYKGQEGLCTENSLKKNAYSIRCVKTK